MGTAGHSGHAVVSEKGHERRILGTKPRPSYIRLLKPGTARMRSVLPIALYI